MIRLIQRRLIIPRGDTGTFTVPVLATKNTGDVAIFSIIDTMTDKKVFEKIVNVSGDTMTIEFSHYDTVNLPVGKYVWDIKFYQNPEFMDGVLVNGVEVDSYYAAFTMPICEIRQTGDNLLMADDAPGTELTPDQLDILNAAVNETNAAKSQANESAASANTAATTASDKADEATAKAEEATAALNELKEILPTLAEVATSGSYNDLEDKPFIPSRVSDLTDDSGHYIKPANGIPASDLEETYLTAHQDLSNYVQKTDYATANEAGVVRVNGSGNGISIDQFGAIKIYPAQSNIVKTADNTNASKYQPITPSKQHESTFYGLAKAAGDTTQSQSNNAIGTYTDSAKTAIQTMLDVPSNAAMTTAIGNAIGNINSFDMAVVQELPAQDISTHTIYLVPKTGETNDVYDEYVYINNAWEMVGNTQIDLSNYVQKTDYATNSSAGVFKLPSDAGLNMFAGQYLMIAPASLKKIQASENGASPITTGVQYASTFYGLAKAAGDTTQRQSDNAVGTYTNEAKAAIQQMLDVPAKADIPDTSIYATKADTVLETTLSRGRKADTTVGRYSLAFGNDVEASNIQAVAFGSKTSATGSNSHSEGNQTLASGNTSHAEGFKSIAGGAASHAEGYNTIASAAYSHVEGKYNIEDSIQSWPTWTPNTEYAIGDKVKILVVNLNNETSFNGYICKIANNDADFVAANWTKTNSMNYAYIIGNGTADDARSNAYALDWDGNGHYMGDVYVGANADSSGGEKVSTENNVALLMLGNLIDGNKITKHCIINSTNGELVPVSSFASFISDYIIFESSDIGYINVENWQTEGVARFVVYCYNSEKQYIGETYKRAVLNANRYSYFRFKIKGISECAFIRVMWGATGVQNINDAEKNHVSFTKSTINAPGVLPNWSDISRLSDAPETAFYGLSKVAGEDLKDDANVVVGAYPDYAKAAIQSMLGISQMLAPVNPNMTAVQAYGVGEVFAANGKLYKAIAAIAQDAAIIPDTNCVETTMVDAGGKIKDVQINGTSVVGSNGVASIPIANASNFGVTKINSAFGISINSNGVLEAVRQNSNLAKAGTDEKRPVVSLTQHEATFYGLSKVAGVDLANETVTLGEYPETSKTAIKAMLGVQDGLKVVRLI